MRKPILLIDQDDVIVEYISGLVELFNERYKTTYKDSDCIEWNLEAIFGGEIMHVMHEPALFRNLKPAPHAIEIFKRLYESNLFEMYIVTAAHPKTVEAKFEWVKEYMPFFPTSHIIVSSVKNMIKGDYLLDDGMHNIEAFYKAGGKPIVFERPHNTNHKDSNYTRIKNWLEFETFILKECYPELNIQHLGNKEIKDDIKIS